MRGWTVVDEYARLINSVRVCPFGLLHGSPILTSLYFRLVAARFQFPYSHISHMAKCRC